MEIQNFSFTKCRLRKWRPFFLGCDVLILGAVPVYDIPLKLILANWGVTKLTIIGPDNGLSPGRRQAIIWTNAGILLIRTPGTNFSGILSEIHTFSFKKMHFKMTFGKWRPFFLSQCVKPKSRAVWCTCSLFLSYLIILTVCTVNRSDTFVFCTKLQNDEVTEIVVTENEISRDLSSDDFRRDIHHVYCYRTLVIWMMF